VRSIEPLRSISLLVQHFLFGSGDHAIEDVVLLRLIQEFGRGVASAATGLAALRVVYRQVHHAAGVRVGERLDQDVLDDAEDGRGGCVMMAMAANARLFQSVCSA
jgi:hypothetical protein